MINTTASRERQKLPLMSTGLQSDSEPSPQQAQELPINSSTALTPIDCNQHIPTKPVTILKAWSPTANTKKGLFSAAANTGKVNQGINSPFPMGREVLSHARTARLHHGNRDLGNRHHSDCPLFPPCSLAVSGSGMSLGSAVLSCPHCVPPNSLCTPLAGRVRGRAALAVPAVLSNWNTPELSGLFPAQIPSTAFSSDCEEG